MELSRNGSFVLTLANGRKNVDQQLLVQHCWELLRPFARVAKTFTGFNLCVTKSQQHATTYNRVCKYTQHVTSNNVAFVCSGRDVHRQYRNKKFVAAERRFNLKGFEF